MKNSNVTRGFGLLEKYLAKKRTKQATQLIPQELNKGKILDIGCGQVPYFLSSSSFKDRYGIDPNLNTEIVKNKSLNLKKIDIEKQKLPFGNNFFDVVTMLAVFEHINNNKLNFVLSEARRVLKEKGVLIITTPAPWVDSLLHFMGRVGLISKEEIGDHKHNHDNIKINQILNDAGFNKEGIHSGYFELGMNMWFRASK